MNAHSATQQRPFWVRAWTIGVVFVGLGALSALLDLLSGGTFPYVWIGVLDFILGIGVAASVLAVTAAHRPTTFRVGAGLLVVFVLVFLANLVLLAVRRPV